MCADDAPIHQISVLIADDERLIRAGFRAILEVRARSGRSSARPRDGLDAIDLARKRSPDVVLLDIRMPGMDGLTAARRIIAETESRVLILTTFDVDEYVFEALRAGASGFLLKDVPPEQLCWAVRSIAAGDALIDPAVTRRLILRFAGAARAERRRPRASRRADPTRARCPAAARPGALQRRDRRRARRRAVDSQDPRRADPDEARSARPRAGGRARIRVRVRHRPIVSQTALSRLGSQH